MSLQPLPSQHAIDVQRAPPRDLMNLGLFSYWLVVDCRHEAAYEHSHIVSSSNLPPPSVSSSALSLLAAFFDRMEESCMFPDRFSPIVLIDDSLCSAHVDSLIAALALARSEAMTSEPTKRWLRKITEPANEVWITSFSAFQRQYPFLISSGRYLSDRPTLDDIGPTPCEFTEAIYLSARYISTDAKTLGRWRITHVICAADEVAEREPVATVDGVVYLRCSIKDSPSVSHDELFRTSANFLEEVTRSGGRALISLHGRHRSAAVLAGYLILKKGLTAASAVESIERAGQLKFRGNLQRDLLPFSQLRALERKALPPN